MWLGHLCRKKSHSCPCSCKIDLELKWNLAFLFKSEEGNIKSHGATLVPQRVCPCLAWPWIPWVPQVCLSSHRSPAPLLSPCRVGRPWLVFTGRETLKGSSQSVLRQCWSHAKDTRLAHEPYGLLLATELVLSDLYCSSAV